MLQKTKVCHSAKILVISVIAISLAACSPATETASTSTDPASLPPANTVTTASSPEAAVSPTSVTIPGVTEVGEISFKPPSKTALGHFDVINNSSTQRIEVSKANPITAAGWAILADKGKPADTVLITQGDNNSLVAVASVNSERPDVSKILKNPVYQKSGWGTTFKASALPAGEVVLKAWVYDSATKEATQLEPTHQVVVGN